MNVNGPSKHTLLELNRRVDDLARKSPTLDKATAQQIATELGVPVGEVTQRFEAQLKVIEGAGDRSKTLRENNQGGMFVGQQKASSTSAAFIGTNLKVPSDVAKDWKGMLDGLNYVIDRVKQGRLGSPAADLEIQGLASKAGNYESLWSPAGTQTRLKLQGAMDELARVLPHAVVATTPGAEPGSIIERRADETALSGHMNEAVFVGDKGKAASLAREYLAKFPTGPMAPWSHNLIADAKGK